jgi:aspartate ammonia-lyase|tara:strand:- start:2813 stop:4222 length:1410 start_codon:yes stop_codon:yes gene_type:complete
MTKRIEKDFLGEVKIPEDAYYGITTERVLQDFKISGLNLNPKFLEAYIILKKACALANMKIGRLDIKLGKAIVQGSDEILSGKLRDQFKIDVFQMGAGTSFNMNCNEVLANRANEILGSKKGDYKPINPNDHVNMSQSTNDTFPTAMRIAILLKLKDLDPELKKLEKSFQEKATQFDNIVKAGRTHLQDAVPIRLGQEFRAYSQTVSKSRRIIQTAVESCREIGIGGSATGTGLNTKIGYREEVLNQLNKMTTLNLKQAEDLREIMQSQSAVAEISASLRNLALELTRISNDLRLLSSGPTTGLAEIRLPAIVAGSSIMPGKINPSILEMLGMVGFQVVGNDLTISMAVQAGQLELNVMMPVMAFNILFSIEILTNAIRLTRTKCIDGIEADKAKCKHYADTTLGLATILNPIIGYKTASEIVKHAIKEEKTILNVLREKQILPEEDITKLLNTSKMTKPPPTQNKKKN